jgi:hypothetical protein
MCVLSILSPRMLLHNTKNNKLHYQLFVTWVLILTCLQHYTLKLNIIIAYTNVDEIVPYLFLRFLVERIVIKRNKILFTSMLTVTCSCYYFKCLVLLSTVSNTGYSMKVVVRHKKDGYDAGHIWYIHTILCMG